MDVRPPWYSRAWGVLTTAAGGLFFATAMAAPAMTFVPPPAGELGATGTPNYSGDVLGESNLKLIHERAYGTAGVRDFGEWEKARRTDEAFNKSLNHVLGPIRDALVSVVEARDNENGQRHADFIRDRVANFAPGCSEFLTQTAGGALSCGFALHEEVWGVVEHPSLPNGRGHGIVKMAERLPRSIKPNGWIEDERGELASIEQLVPKAGKWLNVSLPAKTLFLNSWDRSGNNYLGFSAYRAVWYLMQIRAEIARIIAIGHVRESAGIPIAFALDKDSPDLTIEQRASLERFLSNCVYHENSNVIMPKGWDLKWLFSPGANKGALIAAYNELGKIICAQVGAQQLALGVDGTGSRAVGEVHDATSIAFIQGVISHLEDLLNGASGRPYTGWVHKQIDANFGPQKSYPLIALSLQKPQLKALERFSAVKMARDAGLFVVTKADQNIAREELGFPPLEESEADDGAETEEPGEVDVLPSTTDIVGPPAQGASASTATKAQDLALNGAQVQAAQAIVEAVADGRLPRETGVAMLEEFFNIPSDRAERLMDKVGKGFKPTAPPAPPAPFGGKQAVAPDEEVKPAVVKASAAFQPRRPLRLAETFVDLPAIDELFNAAREKFERGARPLVIEMLARAQADIREAMADGNPSEVAGIELNGLRLEKFVAGYIDDLRAAGFSHASGEMLRFRATGAGVKLAEEDDKDPPAAEEAPPTPPEARSMASHLVRRMKSRLLLDTEREAIHVIGAGGDPDEVVSAVIERQVTGGGFKTDAGIVTTRAFSMGRDEFAETHGADIESCELSAILDKDTCMPCERLDGTEFDFGSTEDAELTPPLSSQCDGGDACRCLKVFHFKRGAA